MDEPKKTGNDQEKKKMVIKMGGGGGGIGAVVLLGGALVTAALASAFLVRKKGWNSSKDRRRRHQNPPPEINKQSEPDETNEEQQFTVLDTSSHMHKHPSGAAKEVESDNDTGLLVSTQSFTLDEKPTIEINGGIQEDIYDIETREEILSSITPKKLENEAISDGSMKVDVHSFDEKLPFELKNTIQEVKIQLTKEEGTNGISKESHNFEQVSIEEERAEREANIDGQVEGKNDKQPREEENSCDQEENEITVVYNDVEGVHIDQMEAQKSDDMKVNIDENELEGCCSDNGEISEEKCDVAIQKTEVDLAAIGLGIDSSLSETIVSQNHSEDGQKILQPVFDNRVIEHENMNVDEEEGALAIGTVEVIQVDEAIVEDQEDLATHFEEQLVKEIIPEKSDPQIEANEEKIPREEENAFIGNPTPENRQFGVPMLKEELISAEDVEVAKEDGANEEVAESLEVNENDIETSVQLVVCQPNNDDAESNYAKAVEEEFISLEDIDVTKEDEKEEEVAENLEMNENKTSVNFVVCQPKDDEVKDSSDTIDTGIATAKDDRIMETNEDEETGEDNIKNFGDETDLSDEVEESSKGNGGSSIDSNSEAVWPAETLQESFNEPQQVKLSDQEVEGKIQEDKVVKEREHDNEITSGEGKGNSERTFIEKYVVELAILKNHLTNSTWRKMLIGILSVLSSLSCSWFFGLSFVKLCLIVFLTMVLSEIHGY